MELLGPAIKLGYVVKNDPQLKLELDRMVDENGQFLSSTEMARELGLPFLNEDSDARQHNVWATTFVENVFGIPMPNTIYEPDGTIRCSWEEE